MQTSETYTLADVIQRIEDEQMWWTEATHNADIAEAERPGLAGEWSFKDVVNHLNIWQGRDIAEIRAALNGESGPGPDWPLEFESIEDWDQRVPKINAWTADRDRSIPLNEAIERYATQLDDLETLVSGLSEETINDPRRIPFLEGKSLAESIMSGCFFRHTHDEHGADMRKWIEIRSVDNPTI
jgi:hypothetical protein